MVGLNDLAADGQSKSGSPGLGSEERLKCPAADGLAHAVTLILHDQFDRGRVGLCNEPHDVATGRSLHGIEDHIDEDLLNLVRVEVNVRESGVAFNFQSDIPRERLRAQQFHGPHDHVSHVAGSHLRDLGSRVDQKVFDSSIQSVYLP